ncbi:MAG: c-type cytochrome [Planctomycetota bacterium]
MRFSRLAIVLALLLVVTVAATRRDLETRSREIFQEMIHSPAAGSQSASAVFADGRTQQPPVPGTIPRGFTPLRYAATDADRERAGRELINPLPPRLNTLVRGRQVYESFCTHCHGASGQGDGGVAQFASALSMSVVGKATADLPDGALFHIVSYGQRNMPSHAPLLSQADRWKLIYYLRDLQWREKERLKQLGIEFLEDPRRFSLVSADYGKEIFAANCVSCHGEEGNAPKRGVPMLNSARVLAVAKEDYYLDIITHGRKGSEMPAWGEILTPTQVRSLALYIRAWSGAEPDRSRVTVGAGNPRYGKAIYRGNCAACHGRRGEGGIGNSLSAPSFLAMASDSFLRDTITRGRSHTAMPSGYQFSPAEISDLLSYIRGWSTPDHTFDDVAALLPGAKKRIGKKIYRAKCASCHGKKGEGTIGPRLNAESFLTMADDRFLYRAIVEGRPETAMPAWHFLTAEDVADLIKYLRDWQKSPPVALPRTRRRGRADFGELLYRQACFACHGPEGRGGVGNQLVNPVFLSSVSDEFLWRTIAHGKDGTAMRGFLKGRAALMPMSGADIEHVIAYLRRLQTQPRVDPPHRPRLGRDIALGREVYMKIGGCAKCHGDEGEGASGPALGNADFLDVASDGYLTGTAILGREGSEMLSFYRGGNVNLTPDQVQAVVAYIRDFATRPLTKRRMVERTVASVAEGDLLFQAHCASCHGSEGHGPRNNVRLNGYAPSLNNPEFLRAADDSFLLATIALGRPGTPMRAFAAGAGGISDLSADEIRKIVAFIRSWEEAHK